MFCIGWVMYNLLYNVLCVLGKSNILQLMGRLLFIIFVLVGLSIVQWFLCFVWVVHYTMFCVPWVTLLFCICFVVYELHPFDNHTGKRIGLRVWNRQLDNKLLLIIYLMYLCTVIYNRQTYYYALTYATTMAVMHLKTIIFFIRCSSTPLFH